MEGINPTNEKHELTYQEILKKYTQEGGISKDKWQEAIDKIEGQFLKYYEMPSVTDFQHRLKETFDPSLMLGVWFPTELKGYETDIKSGLKGESARIVIHGESYDGQYHSSMKKDMFESFSSDFNDENEPLSAVWDSGGMTNEFNTFNLPHKGVYLDETMRRQDLAYGMYALHERIFGEQKSELTPKLSLLKLYMKLGFIPKKALNPIDGTPTEMGIDELVATYFSNGEEELLFPIYMEREKINSSQEQADVLVLDISDFSDWKEFRESIDKNKIKLGDENIENSLNSLLKSAKAQSKKIFFLKWEGMRTPRGTVVDGKEIGWTSNGIVTDKNGEHIGAYERIIGSNVNNPDSSKEQQMLVFLK